MNPEMLLAGAAVAQAVVSLALLYFTYQLARASRALSASTEAFHEKQVPRVKALRVEALSQAKVPSPQKDIRVVFANAGLGRASIERAAFHVPLNPPRRGSTPARYWPSTSENHDAEVVLDGGTTERVHFALSSLFNIADPATVEKEGALLEVTWTSGEVLLVPIQIFPEEYFLRITAETGLLPVLTVEQASGALGGRH